MTWIDDEVSILQYLGSVFRVLAGTDGSEGYRQDCVCHTPGLIRFTVMPFGLCNVPITFKRLMELVLSGLNWKIFLIYLYNVSAFGGTFTMH